MESNTPALAGDTRAATNGVDSDPDPILQKSAERPYGDTPNGDSPGESVPRVLTSQPASALWIYILMGWALGGSTLMLVLATQFWDATSKGATTLNTPELSMACILGALGGFIHCLQSLGVYVGNRQLLSSWIPYYFFYPMKGAALSFIVILLVKSGLSSSTPTDASGDMIKMCAIASLTGLFSNQALQMCGDVFDVVFGKVRAKDDLGSSAPKTPTAAAKAATDTTQS